MAYSTGIQRATLQTSGCFNDALNNTHKDLEAPHEPTQQQGFLWKTPHQLQSKAPYKFCLVTIATLLRRSHRVVQDTIQVIEPIRLGEEKRHRPRFKIGYKERSSNHSYSLAPTETLDSTGFSY